MSLSMSESTIVYATVPLFGFGIAQIVVGSMVYHFTSNLHIGAWYVGVFAVVNACCGYAAYTKRNAYLIGVFPLVTVLTATAAFIGTLIDGIAYAMYGYVKACGNDGVTFWGDPNYVDDVLDQCTLPGDRDCYCVYGTRSLCLTYNGNGPNTFNADNCEPLIGWFPDILRSSWSLSLAIFFYCWFMFSVGCCGCIKKMQTGNDTPPAIVYIPPTLNAPPAANNSSYPGQPGFYAQQPVVYVQNSPVHQASYKNSQIPGQQVVYA